MKVSKQQKIWHGQQRTVWVIDHMMHGERICVASVKGRAACVEKYRKRLKEREARHQTQAEKRKGQRMLETELLAWFDLYRTEAAGYTGATVTSDRAQMEKIRQALGRMPIREITRDTVQEYLHCMEAEGLAVQTRKRRLFILRQFFRSWYMDDPACDPTRGIKTPVTRARSKEPPAALDDEQMMMLTEYLLAPGTLHGEALAVMLWHFLRAGELIGLKPADIDGGRLHIKRQITWSKEPGKAGIWAENPPKRGSVRIVPLMEPVRERITRAAEEARADGRPYLYKGDALPHLTPYALRTALNRALKACGIGHMRIHDLRHSGISYLIRHGVPVEAVSRWAGHASITVTLGVYYQMIPAQITAAEEQAQKIFESLKP